MIERESEPAPLRPRMNKGAVSTAKQPIINAIVVKTRRKQLGITQVQLAIMAACSPHTVRQIERGKQLDPATSVTLRIAKSLSVTVEALCAGARPYEARYSHRQESVLPAGE